MPIPGPGTAISVNTIVGEFGGTAPHSLSEYYRGGGLVPNTPGNAAIPTTGAIPMGGFYGSANRSAVALTISANSYNYDVYTNRGPTYVAGASDITVTVNPGVTVGSTSTGAYAMLVPSAFSPTDTVTIVNNGVIQGMGGGGGAGAPGPGGSGGAGATGGNALYVNRPVVVTNNGTVAGGGGGGGGGGNLSVVANKSPYRSGGGGGGGGAGFNGGAAGGGGGGGSGPAPGGGPGGAGTSPAGGGGGGGGPIPGYGTAGPGGAGGGRGAAGSAGSPASSAGGGAGGAGAYIVGNPFVTWPATGTRSGGVA